jgi:hypothetical protein
LVLIACHSAPADESSRRELRPGLEEIRLDWKRGPHTGTLTALAADPERFELELLTAEGDGGRRRPQEWAEEYRLVAVINASMYQPNGRSTALLIDDGVVNNGLDHPSYGGILAFEPRRAQLPPLRIFGRDCGDYDLARLREDYANLIQNYRLLDCRAKAVEWRDARPYTATAVATDQHGRIVFVHSGGALLMREFARILTARELRLRAALFTEGGAQAALIWRDGERWAQAIPSADDDPTPARSIPNVLGLRARAAD